MSEQDKNDRVAKLCVKLEFENFLLSEHLTYDEKVNKFSNLLNQEYPPHRLQTMSEPTEKEVQEVALAIDYFMHNQRTRSWSEDLKSTARWHLAKSEVWREEKERLVAELLRLREIVSAQDVDSIDLILGTI